MLITRRVVSSYACAVQMCNCKDRCCIVIHNVVLYHHMHMQCECVTVKMKANTVKVIVSVLEMSSSSNWTQLNIQHTHTHTVTHILYFSHSGFIHFSMDFP